MAAGLPHIKTKGGPTVSTPYTCTVREFVQGFYFVPTKAMRESGMAGPYLDLWGPHPTREAAILSCTECTKEAQAILEGTSPNEDLLGKTYVDTKDSGDLIMQVVAIDPLMPDSCVLVSPIGYDRIWWRNADVVRGLIEGGTTGRAVNCGCPQ